MIQQKFRWSGCWRTVLGALATVLLVGCGAPKMEVDDHGVPLNAALVIAERLPADPVIRKAARAYVYARMEESRQALKGVFSPEMAAQGAAAMFCLTGYARQVGRFVPAADFHAIELALRRHDQLRKGFDRAESLKKGALLVAEARVEQACARAGVMLW